MSNVLIINPILYTAETNRIPQVDSIKDTMIYALCMGFVHQGHNVTLIAAQDYRPVKQEEYPFTVIFMKTVWHRVFLPRCVPYMPGLRGYLRGHKEYDRIISSEVFAPWSYTAVRMCCDTIVIWQELAAHNHMLHQLPSKFWYHVVARWLMRRARVVARSEAAASFIRQFMPRVSDTVIDHGVDLDKLDTILRTSMAKPSMQQLCASSVSGVHASCSPCSSSACVHCVYMESVPGKTGECKYGQSPDDSLLRREKEKQFVVVSQLIDRKRIHRIIEVFSEFVNAGHEEYRLYIIGSGEREAQLRALAEERAMQEQVIFCGQMTHEQLLPIVAASLALLVYTSKDNNMVSIVESIAVGTPVVTTPVPYNAAYIRREQLGIVEEEWTLEALARIVEDNVFYRENCLRYRRKLSNDFCAETFTHI